VSPLDASAVKAHVAKLAALVPSEPAWWRVVGVVVRPWEQTR
jgi:hypothetical protein